MRQGRASVTCSLGSFLALAANSMQSNQTMALPVLLVFWLMVLALIFKTAFISIDRLLCSEKENFITSACVVINARNFPRAVYHAYFFLPPLFI